MLRTRSDEEEKSSIYRGEFIYFLTDTDRIKIKYNADGVILYAAAWNRDSFHGFLFGLIHLFIQRKRN